MRSSYRVDVLQLVKVGEFLLDALCQVNKLCLQTETQRNEENNREQPHRMYSADVD